MDLEVVRPISKISLENSYFPHIIIGTFHNQGANSGGGQIASLDFNTGLKFMDSELKFLDSNSSELLSVDRLGSRCPPGSSLALGTS